MKKEFNWEEFKNSKIAVHCRTNEETQDFMSRSKYNNIYVNNNILDYIEDNENKDISFDYFDSNELDCFCDINYYIYKNYKIIQWSDYMVNTKEEVQEYIVEEEINPTKTQYNLIELSDLPNGSKLYFERNNTKIHVYIDEEDGCLRYEDDDKPFIPYKDNLKATFTLVSLPSKEVTFKEAIEEFSKGGNIQSELNGNKKIYIGLTTSGKQKEGLTANGRFSLTTEEILNAKWYILNKED